ncbi:dihydrouridine synthase [Thermoleophilia bacterium SCSIO 60948]|nr:dihydrouridine synthase [Thermoleophilia bacterium SCSIO 60948]
MQLTEPFEIGGVRIPNRVLLAPLAGIGNWFVRLQARRYGAGAAVSEMVSSHALHHGNERTTVEMLRTHPDEGPLALQLFGADPDVMRSAARIAAEGARPDLIDLNMGCPVPKIRKSGAGVELLADQDLAVEVARAAGEGSGLPVTVKLRSGLEPGDTRGVTLARRLVAEAGVAAISFHPRSARVQHKGKADYALARELAGSLDVPVIISGGMRGSERARERWEESGAAALMVARGGMGNPWIFSELLGFETPEPGPERVVAELRWVIANAREHWGEVRAARNLRKFYPWYLERIGIGGAEAHAFQTTTSLDEVESLLGRLERGAAVAA